MTLAFPWGAIGNSNNELSDISMALLEGKAYDPATLETHELSLVMNTLSEIANPGPTHHLIGYAKGSEVMGAFEWTPLSELTVKPSQQSMWAADGKGQTTISATPTHGGEVVDKKAAKDMVAKRSRWHINRNLALSSQGIAMAVTQRTTHGGRTWKRASEYF